MMIVVKELASWLTLVSDTMNLTTASWSISASGELDGALAKVRRVGMVAFCKASELNWDQIWEIHGCLLVFKIELEYGIIINHDWLLVLKLNPNTT